MTILLLSILFLACILVGAAVEARAALEPLVQLPPRQWKPCEFARNSVVSAIYRHEWTSDQLHDAADTAYFDGDLALRDLLRATAHAVELRERIEREQRRQLQSVRPVVQVPGVLA